MPGKPAQNKSKMKAKKRESEKLGFERKRLVAVEKNLSERRNELPEIVR